MTCILAAKSPEGIVMAGESQVTSGDRIAYTEKLSIENAGLYTLVVGGGGAGELIAGFTQHLTEKVSRIKAPGSQKLTSVVRMALKEFYGDDVRTFPAKDEDKVILFLIGAKLTSGSDLYLWETKASRLFDVKDYAVIGVEDALCRYLFKRYIPRIQAGSPVLSIPQLVAICVYILSVVTSISTFGGGPTSVAIIRDFGVFLEHPDYVRNLEKRFEEYDQHVNRILLAAADMSVSPNELRAGLDEFSKSTLSLHQAHLDSAAKQWASDVDSASPLKSPSPYHRIPMRTVVRMKADGAVDARYDVDATAGVQNSSTAAPENESENR